MMERRDFVKSLAALTANVMVTGSPATANFSAPSVNDVDLRREARVWVTRLSTVDHHRKTRAVSNRVTFTIGA